MPHCIIEYTKELETRININELMNAAFESVASSGLFNNTAIKARAIAIDQYKSGLERNDYIHITVRILSGRTAEQKKYLSETVMNGVKPFIGNTKSTTIEIVDMDKDSYAKHIDDT